MVFLGGVEFEIYALTRRVANKPIFLVQVYFQAVRILLVAKSHSTVLVLHEGGYGWVRRQLTILATLCCICLAAACW